jgi:hypothetical protein
VQSTRGVGGVRCHHSKGYRERERGENSLLGNAREWSPIRRLQGIEIGSVSSVCTGKFRALPGCHAKQPQLPFPTGFLGLQTCRVFPW